jgi:hypothetical protein
LAAKPAAGHGAWVSGTPAGTSAGCMKIPGDSWLGDGRRPWISGGDRASERHGGAVLYGLSRRAEEGVTARRVRIPNPSSR